MPQVSFAGSQGMIQSNPVQYNVSPNLSASRAFDNLSKALQGGMQLATQINEDNFREEGRNLELMVAQKKEEWAGMTYEQRKGSMESIKADLVDKYGADTYYGRQLRNSGEKAFAAFGAQLRDQGVKEEYLQNATSQYRGMVDFSTDWANAKDQTERLDLLNKFNNTFVAPYEGFKDEYSMKLYETGLRGKQAYQENFNKIGIAIADEKYLSDVADAIPMFIKADGTMLADNYDTLIEKLRSVSTFEQNESKFRAALGQQVVYAIVNEANSQPPTWENALVFQANLEAFSMTDPRIKNSDTYKSALNAVESFKAGVNNQDKQSLTSLVTNDRAPTADVEKLGQQLVDRGAISVEQLDNAVFQKEQNLIDKNVGLDAYKLVSANDIAGLQDLVAKGKKAAVTTAITSNIGITLAANLEKLASEANTMSDKEYADKQFGYVAQAMKERQNYIDQGLPVGNFDQVDQILAMNMKGNLTSNSAISTWLRAMELSIENNYQPSEVNKTALKDYAVLKGFQELNVEDIPTAFESYKTSTLRVTNADIKDALDTIVLEQDSVSLPFTSYGANLTTEEMNTTNYQQFKTALMPAIEAGLRAGLPISEIKKLGRTMIDAQYINISPFYWSRSDNRLLIPKVGAIQSADKYQNVADFFGSATTVLPVDINNPSGQWMVLPTDGGDPQLHDFGYIEFIAKTGKAPK